MAKKEKPMKINPNVDCKAGKIYKLGFRTGTHTDARKEISKMACRNWKRRGKKDLED